jgi:hypothetical protein
VFRGCLQPLLAFALAGAVFALGGCSIPKISALGAARDQPEDTSCEALNAERDRLRGERDELTKPQLSSKTDAQRRDELAQLNGKLYTVAKAEFDKSCPAVANASPSTVVR